MASPSIMRILDTARVHAPGALDGALRMEFFNTLKDFLRVTCLWQEFLTVYVATDAYDYDLVTASRGVIHMLMSLGKIQIGGSGYTQGGDVNLDANNDVSIGLPGVGSFAGALVTNPGNAAGGDFTNDQNSDFAVTASEAPSALGYTPAQWSRALASKSPRRGALIASGAQDAILRIYDLPNAAELWIAEVALTITDPIDGEGIPYAPDWIIQKYQDALTDGLLSRVMVHPAKPYSNKEGAAFHGRRYMNGTTSGKADARRGSTFGGQRWAYPTGFRTFSQRGVR